MDDEMVVDEAGPGAVLGDPSWLRGVTLGACPTLTFLLRRTIRNHLRRARPEKILNVFQRIHLRFFRACGLASGRTSFASSRRQCRTGSLKEAWLPEKTIKITIPWRASKLKIQASVGAPAPAPYC